MKKTYTKEQIIEAIAYWKKQLKAIDEAVAETNGFNDPAALIKFLEQYPQHKDCIFKSSDKWTVTDEWLVGTFAGRGWEGDTKEEAAQQMIDYLNKHIGHKSMVGSAVTNSGWPNVESVKQYIDNAIEDTEED